MRKYILLLLTIFPLTLAAQTETPTDSLFSEQTLDDVVVSQRRAGTRRLGGVENGTLVMREELFRAACCNLGESFTTNPSVDVSYDDATTGARQIKLLGLNGRYVQMLTDNQPDFRGSAQPFALGFVPGPWMKSIQVSKGASSVKNGYESVTGQINVTLLPAEDVQSLTANVYGDLKGRAEANLMGNYHLTDRLSTALLTHYENRWEHHDENNDGFLDQPRQRQINLHNRWAYLSPRYIFHGSISLLDEHRQSGQTDHLATHARLWQSTIDTHRYQATMKHAYVLNAERAENIALMATATMNRRDDAYGTTLYGVNEKNLYAQLMYEGNLTPLHNLSAGLTYTHDYLRQDLSTAQSLVAREQENVFGGYLQYTFNLHDHLIAMAGLRADHSRFATPSSYMQNPSTNTFLTPRFHLKWQPLDLLSVRLSAGKGYRRPHALAEQARFLARGGVTEFLSTEMESAWNYGVNAALYIPLGGQTLQVNAEYYYTDFQSKFLVDRDSRPGCVLLYSSRDRNYSHALQVDATYPVFRGMTLTAAFRRNIVKETYQSLSQSLSEPLVSRYKGLLTASYKTPLGLWQVDATLQLNGSGRMPTPYTLADGTPSWDKTYPAYEQLSLQVTRWFRYFSVYAGGENLTGFRHKHLIVSPDQPWSADFDPTLVWGPVHGPLVYAGVRLNIEKM